jgi:hypothetical protein
MKTGDTTMTKTIRIAALAAAGLMAAALHAAPAEAAKANCVKAGGTATSPTTDIATFMAKAALKNSIEAQGRKQVGPESVKCDGQFLGPTCVAHAKACK